MECRAGAEPLRQRVDRIREPSSNDRTQDTRDIEAHGQDQEGTGLVLALDGDLGDHGSDDSHKTIDAAGKDAPEHGHAEGGRETVSEAADGGAEGADEQNHLAAAVDLGGVGDFAPEDGCEDLGAGETTGQETGLSRDLCVGEDGFCLG